MVNIIEKFKILITESIKKCENYKLNWYRSKNPIVNILSPIFMIVYVIIYLLLNIGLFILNFVGMFRGVSMEFFKKPDTFYLQILHKP